MQRLSEFRLKTALAMMKMASPIETVHAAPLAVHYRANGQLLDASGEEAIESLQGAR
jgi:hypothetical protein